VALVERQVAPTLDREAWPELAAWLQALPRELIESRPRLLLAQCWIYHLRGRHLLLRESLARAERLLAAAEGDDPSTRALAGELDVLRLSGATPAQADPSFAVETCARALSRLDPTARYVYGFAEAQLAHAIACADDLPEAERLLRRQWTTAGDASDAGSIRGLFAFAMLMVQRGDLPAVETHAAALRDLSERAHLRLSLGWARYLLAWCAWQRGALDETIAISSLVAGDHACVNLICLRESLFLRAIALQVSGFSDEARQSLEWARDRLIADGAVEHLDVVTAQASWLALLRGSPQETAGWARATRARVDWSPLQATVHPVLVQAAALCALGGEDDFRLALDLLAPLRARAERLGFTLTLVQTDSIEAVAVAGLGQATGAPAAASPPDAWGRQLEVILPDREPVPPGGAAGASVALLPAGTTILSRRERQILALLQAGLSNAEIAEQCYISPHTVKRHLANMYAKLNVANRREAIALSSTRGPGVAPPREPGHGQSGAG
jgi:ATP/maltotriose-dependent transcriptional regulator MalT